MTAARQQAVQDGAIVVTEPEIGEIFISNQHLFFMGRRVHSTVFKDQNASRVRTFVPRHRHLCCKFKATVESLNAVGLPIGPLLPQLGKCQAVGVREELHETSALSSPKWRRSIP